MKRDRRASSNPIATVVSAALRFPKQAHAIGCNQFCGETQVGSASRRNEVWAEHTC
jgi:hypothetical protein